MDDSNLQIQPKQTDEKKSLMPDGMQKIIRNEKIKQFIIFFLSSSIFFASAGYIIYLALITKPTWSSYIIPGILISISLYKLSKTLSERNDLIKQLRDYKQNLKQDDNYVPLFINEVYKKTIKKQIYHNWITFIIFFYGAILITLLLLLKDVSWWILDFKYFFKKIFINPDMWIKILAGSLGLAFILYLLFRFQRNKKLQDIKSFFGKEIFSLTDEQNIKKNLNKTLRRLFLLKLMIITIIPILVLLILKRKTLPFLKKK